MVDESQEELMAMREVDDELRRKELENLWNKFRKYIIGGIALIIIIVAGNATYTTVKINQEESSSLEFSNALDKADADGADVAKVWEEALGGLDANYAYMGKMHLAASHVKAKKYDDALAVYKDVINSSDVDVRLKDLSILYSGIIHMDYSKDYDAARSMFMLLSGNKESAFHLSASEQIAVLDIHEGNFDSALATLKSIAADTGVSVGMKERATKLISVVEVRKQEK